MASFVQSIGSSSNADTQDLIFGTNVLANSLIPVWVNESGGSGTVDPVITDSRSNTYTRIIRGNRDGGTVSLWATRNATAGALTISLNGGTDVALRCAAAEFSPDSGKIFSALVADSGSWKEGDFSSPEDSTSEAAAAAGSVLLSVIGSVADISITSAGSGWTNLPDGFARVFAAYRIAPSAGSFNASWTYTGSASAFLMAAFDEESVGGASNAKHPLINSGIVTSLVNGGLVG